MGKLAKHFCSLCELPLLLCESTLLENVCDDCVRRIPVKYRKQMARCPTCERVGLVDDIFHCGWCFRKVCTRCVYKEHQLDDCTNPDDCCFRCGDLIDDCECGEEQATLNIPRDDEAIAVTAN